MPNPPSSSPIRGGNIMPPPSGQTLSPEDAVALPLHEFAEWMPPMGDAEYAMLRDDIHANGQRQSIVLHEGAVLDGRHRLRACVELQIPVRYAVLPGNLRPDEYVLSANMRRRNINASQMAIVACRMVNSTRGNQALAARENLVTQSEAAGRVGVSDRYVRDAAWLLENAPDAADAVWRGQQTLAAAVRDARRGVNPARRRQLRRTEENEPSIPVFPANPALAPAPPSPSDILLAALVVIPSLDYAAWLATLPPDVVRQQLPAAEEFFRRALDAAEEEGLLGG